MYIELVKSYLNRFSIIFKPYAKVNFTSNIASQPTITGEQI
jgi:hypothetical protein